VIIQDIYLKNDTLCFRVKYCSAEPFFDVPCNSTLIGIYKISGDEMHLPSAIINDDQIFRKCFKASNVLISDDHSISIVISLLH